MSNQVGRELRPIGGDVSASEAGNYVYCAKAWHLEHVLGAEPSAAASARRTSGAKAHAAHGASIRPRGTRVSTLLVRALIALLVAAIVLLLLGVALASR